jgi:hypothetical protein
MNFFSYCSLPCFPLWKVRINSCSMEAEMGSVKLGIGSLRTFQALCLQQSGCAQAFLFTVNIFLTVYHIRSYNITISILESISFTAKCFPTAYYYYYYY